MPSIPRNLDADLCAIIDDLERRHILVVTQDTIVTARANVPEVTTRWIASHSVREQGNADTRTNSATDTKA